ncbi:molecular chaperone [Salmonella enterica]|uniref:Chaperone protein FimC n=1 Tax=Salmonella enterica subsp. enterica serovar Sanjuan TaxID=1160765 RepID=A0A447P315_SALET|nr:molecular chaperone [Salmonella enterica]ECS6017868.1 molecular chaperone [Salmonella enterica subsp. enterica serovar Rough O:k:1,5]EDW5020752.1 molecular chaperone [Salmonella enterica subsp. enterica]EDX2370510.1 molecular chaperone [Salmonella enterica subsp. enterica serovar Memphis]VEA09907.1 chaperone protein FimC [Salmonella enterica subsp. enterica serovar Sanjuan]EBU3152311.1 molecular chaperone [Salmonella enterica]
MKRYSPLIAATFLFTMTTAQAGVVVGGTRIIYNGDKKETSISVKNPDKSSYLIQSWSDSGENSTAKSPFMVTPPLFRLGAGQENMLRIIRTDSSLPEDKESLFWMNIKSIPATEKQDNVNTLQIAVKTRIKLIYRPQALSQQPENVTEKLIWKRSGSNLTVTNPTAYYMNFSTLKVGNSTVKDATYVAPMSTATFTLPAGSTAGDVRWTLISDYGSAGNEHHSPL